MRVKNPVLLCDFSDPDVISAVDKNGNPVFYLVASSFNFVPGLPVLKSYDLANWTLVSYALKKIPLAGYEKPCHAKGVWAPSIRFYDGAFWIFFATPDEGIFEVHSKNPENSNSWTNPRCIFSASGLIDPCPYIAPNGEFFIVHAYAKSRIGFNSKLGILCAKNGDWSSQQIFDSIIFDGTKTQPTIEGPKVYEKDGFVYILAPAGGVDCGWQTALKSQSIFGTWQEKIVLKQGTTKINGPHQGALFSDQNGDWYFAHFQSKGIFGRILHIQNARWKNGWPQIGKNFSGEDCGEPQIFFEGPKNFFTQENSSKKILEKKSRENFENIKSQKFSSKIELAKIAKQNGRFFETKKLLKNLSLKTEEQITPIFLRDFQFLANGFCKKDLKNPQKKFSPFPLWENPFVLTKKIDCEKFSFQKKIPKSDFCKTPHGIIFLGEQYAALVLENFQIRFLKSQTLQSSQKNEEKRFEEEISKVDFSKNCLQVVLQLYFCANKDNFALVDFFAEITENYGGKICKRIWKANDSAFSTKNAHWVGGRFGVF